MKRIASADDVFNAFDTRIDSWIGANRAQLESQYKKAAGRAVSDSEISEFFDILGESLYSGIQLDPGAVKRFVDFHTNDQKLGQMADDMVMKAAAEGSVPTPFRGASMAKRIAAKWLSRK